MSYLRAYYYALAGINRLIGPPLRYGETDGATAFQFPGITGAKSMSFWINVLEIYQGFFMDFRVGGYGYWWWSDTPQNMRVWVNGTQWSFFGYSVVSDPRAWVKVYIEADAASSAFTLLSRLSENEFFGKVQIGDLRVYSRTMTEQEKTDGNSLGLTDSILARYSFLNYTNGQLRDSSGNGWHARLIGTLPITN